MRRYSCAFLLAVTMLAGAFANLEAAPYYKECRWRLPGTGECLDAVQFYLLVRYYVFDQDCATETLTVSCATLSVRADLVQAVDRLAVTAPSSWPGVGSFGANCHGPHTLFAAPKALATRDLQALVAAGTVRVVTMHVIGREHVPGLCTPFTPPDIPPAEEPPCKWEPLPKPTKSWYVMKIATLGGKVSVFTHVYAPNPDGEPAMTDWPSYPNPYGDDCGDPWSFSGIPTKGPLAFMLVPAKGLPAMSSYLLGSK